MAVAFDAKTAAVTNVNAVATMTVSNLTVGSGSNRAMAVLIYWATGTVPSGITATWDSGGTNQAMTLIAGTNAGAGGAANESTSAYGLIAPTAGNKSLVISWTGNQEAHATAISFTGVDQTSVAVAFPHGTTNIKTVSTAQPNTVTITSATGNMVVAGHEQDVGAYGAISNTTLAKDDTTGPGIGVAFNYASGASSVTMTAAFTGSAVWGSFGFDVLAAGGAAFIAPKPLIVPQAIIRAAYW